jgi:hypothetical protein
VIDDGTWHHVAIRRSLSAGSFAIFIDGCLDFSVVGNTYTVPDGRVINLHQDLTMSTPTNTGPYWYGSYWRDNGFIGGLDDLKFFNEQLSDSQILQLVPEPATLTLLLLGGIAALRKRKA